jgi:YgiT-type zinc finger domain-containing protein
LFFGSKLILLFEGPAEKQDEAIATYHIDRKGYHLTLDTVPAWVCHQCGETYFEEHEVNSIQDIIQILEDRTGKMIAVA